MLKFTCNTDGIRDNIKTFHIEALIIAWIKEYVTLKNLNDSRKRYKSS